MSIPIFHNFIQAYKTNPHETLDVVENIVCLKDDQHASKPHFYNQCTKKDAHTVNIMYNITLTEPNA